MPLWSIHCCTQKISKHVGEVIGWNTITEGGVPINLAKQLSNILMLDEKNSLFTAWDGWQFIREELRFIVWIRDR